MAYVTLATLKGYLGNQRTGTANDDRLQAALDAAHQAIDNACQRKFVVASGSSARVYRPLGRGVRLMGVHDCTAITSVVEDGTTLTAGTSYQAEPLNGLTWAGESVPYDSLRRLGADWLWDDDTATVTVTASWGWAAIPAPVVEACKILAKDIALTREVQFDVAAFGEFGALRVRQNPQVNALLADYRRIESFGIA